MPVSRHSHQTKLLAVELVQKKGYTARQAGDQVGVHASTIRHWIQRFGAPTHDAVVDVEDPVAEIRRLRAELAQARVERDILKKATQFFARDAS